MEVAFSITSGLRIIKLVLLLTHCILDFNYLKSLPKNQWKRSSKTWGRPDNSVENCKITQDLYPQPGASLKDAFFLESVWSSWKNWERTILFIDEMDVGHYFSNFYVKHETT